MKDEETLHDKIRKLILDHLDKYGERLLLVDGHWERHISEFGTTSIIDRIEINTSK